MKTLKEKCEYINKNSDYGCMELNYALGELKNELSCVKNDGKDYIENFYDELLLMEAIVEASKNGYAAVAREYGDDGNPATQQDIDKLYNEIKQELGE